MTKYQITLKYVAYTHYEIEANSPEEAEAHAQAGARYDDEGYGEWTTDSIEEVKA